MSDASLPPGPSGPLEPPPVSSAEPTAPPTNGAAGAAEPPGAAPPAPAPEPLTPERLAAENARNDRFIAAGVIVLAFLLASFRIDNGDYWINLASGRFIAQTRTIPRHDVFAFTAQGRPWVNPSWLYDLASYGVFRAFDRIFSRFSPDAGHVALGVLKAAVVALTIGLLLTVRRRGPTLWWTAAALVIALVAMAANPLANPLQLSPEVVTMLGLAAALAILFQARQSGRSILLWTLPPLALVLANLTPTYWLVLVAVALALVGEWIERWRPAAGTPPLGGPSLGWKWAILSISVAACLVNPWGPRTLLAGARDLGALARFWGRVPVQLARHGSAAFNPLDPATATYKTLSPLSEPYLGPYFHRSDVVPTYWLSDLIVVAAVVLTVVSFGVNRRHWTWPRLVLFLGFTLLGLTQLSFLGPWLLVMAVVLGLNFQEWAEQRFGTEPRLTRRWLVWSSGGRALTIVGIFGLIIAGVTGYLAGSFTGPTQHQWGYGVDRGQWMFGGADFLRRAYETGQLRGGGFNWTFAQGSLLAWENFPVQKIFIDGRTDVYAPGVYDDYKALRAALRRASDPPKRADAEARAETILDRYDLTYVMLDVGPDSSQYPTFFYLARSPKWIRFYDDGQVALFGRAGGQAAMLPADRRGLFQPNRLDLDRVAYHPQALPADNPAAVPAAKPLPTPTPPVQEATWVDRLWRTRRVFLKQAALAERERILGMHSSAMLPVPAACLDAIRDARRGAGEMPNHPVAYTELAYAYADLYAEEIGMLYGREPEAVQAPVLLNLEHQAPPAVMLRATQVMAALNQALITDPDPELNWRVHLQLGQIYLDHQVLDLALEHLRLAARAPAIDEAEKRQIVPQISGLETAVEEVRKRLDTVPEGAQAALQKASIAYRGGCLGMALDQLRSVADTNPDLPYIANPGLGESYVEWYLMTGQAEKAWEAIKRFGSENSLGPGKYADLMGWIKLLLGDYTGPDGAIEWWEQALAQIRVKQARDFLGQENRFLFGTPVASDPTAAIVTGPRDLVELSNREAGLQFSLGMVHLEVGETLEAAKNFEGALKIRPTLPQRRILVYYYRHLTGKDLPPVSRHKEPMGHSNNPPRGGLDRALGARPGADSANDQRPAAGPR